MRHHTQGFYFCISPIPPHPPPPPPPPHPHTISRFPHDSVLTIFIIQYRHHTQGFYFWISPTPSPSSSPPPTHTQFPDFPTTQYSPSSSSSTGTTLRDSISGCSLSPPHMYIICGLAWPTTWNMCDSSYIKKGSKFKKNKKRFCTPMCN